MVSMSILMLCQLLGHMEYCAGGLKTKHCTAHINTMCISGQKKKKKLLLLFLLFFSLSHLPASNGHPSLLAASSVSSDKPPWLHPPLSGFVERRQSSPGSPPALCVHSRQNLTGRGSAARPDDLTRRQEAAGGGSAHRPTNGS